MSHRLDPLLRPRSVAVIGATERAHSVGRRTVSNLLAGGFDGQLYPINPGRASVLNLPCFASLTDLPEQAEHIVFCVGDHRIEEAVIDAINHGCRAMTIMSQLILEGDPGLAQRIEARINEAGILLCGPNGMGFYNPHDGVWMCGFDTRENHLPGGNVTLISHSGAGMSGIVDCEERIDFNLAVSTGQEMNVGLHDYMDFAIREHKPRAIGLFMETARDPAGLIEALQLALDHKIPVVAIKVGRTALSAQLAQSHSGALAGEDAAYQALFDRYGVQRVNDMDELATALIMFAQPHPVAAGSLVAIHDSGGERQLLIDLAEQTRTPLTDLSSASTQQLAQKLDPGLPPVNPLDAWGAGGPDSDHIMENCLATMMKDPGAAFGAVVQDRAPYGKIYPEYVEYLHAGHAASGKPAFLVANRQGSGNDPLAIKSTRAGFPVIDGLRSFLVGTNCLLSYRDFMIERSSRQDEFAGAADDVQDLHTAVVPGPGSWDEYAALTLLEQSGIPISPCTVTHSLEETLQAAGSMRYPLVLKTAQAGLQHKTEQQGVVLGLADSAQLKTAWLRLHERLGPRMLVAEMAPSGGHEMVLGMTHDAQFGPLIMLGFGGVSLEVLPDVAYALPPFDESTALRLINQLRQRPLLDGIRGAPPVAITEFARLAARFSRLAINWADTIDEIDINPVIVHPGGAVAVDALIIPSPHSAQATESQSQLSITENRHSA